MSIIKVGVLTTLVREAGGSTHMESLYITNYSDKRCSPLNSITRLSTDDAYRKAKELSQHAQLSFTSFSRFCENHFAGYYNKRLRTEQWLYDSFMSLGGKPRNTHPLYFVLGDSTYLYNWYEDGVKTRLLLCDIDSEVVSFTFGDSMSKMDSHDRMFPFNKQSLFDFIHETTSDIFAFLSELDRNNRYIEVQLWDDAYVKP